MKEIKFRLRFDQKGPGFYDVDEFYRKVDEILLSNQIATQVTQPSVLRMPSADGDILHIEIPYLAKNDVDSNALTIERIKSALVELLDKSDLYSNLQIIEEKKV